MMGSDQVGPFQMEGRKAVWKITLSRPVYCRVQKRIREDIVFQVLPRNASTLPRELLYTGLTRFQQKLALLIERRAVLETLRRPERSDTRIVSPAPVIGSPEGKEVSV